MPTGSLFANNPPWTTRDIANDEHHGTSGAKKVLLVDQTGTAVVTGSLGVRVSILEAGTGSAIGATNGLHSAPVNTQLVVLRASATATGSGLGTTISGLAPYSAMTVLLAVTAMAGTSPNLNVAVQRLAPDGTMWDTFVRFSQVTTTAAGGTGTQIADVVAAGGNSPRQLDGTTVVTAAQLAAGQARDVPWGNSVRVIWTTSTGTTAPNFTFAVTANFRV